MLVTCKCLNLTVEAKEAENGNSGPESPKLHSAEELEYFFKDVKEAEIIKVTRQITSLTQSRSMGAWKVEQCLNCSINCYAINSTNSNTLINASLISTSDAISYMRNHKDFSPVFRIIIQSATEDKGPELSSIRHNNDEIENVLSSLQQKLRDSIREEVTKTEEKIRLFNEEQYALLETFRNRATSDHRALARKIYEAQKPLDENQMSMLSNNFENMHHRVDGLETSLNRRLLTPKKSDTVPGVPQESETKGRLIPARSINPFTRVPDKVACSLDSEGLFVLEGMEESGTNEPLHSEGESDTDHDDSGSHDEGIDVHRKRPPSFQLAKSLPVNVPVYSVTPSDFNRDDEPSDAVDIAASIKALARSVHGDTVFGDLPRPRFSTQI